MILGGIGGGVWSYCSRVVWSCFCGGQNLYVILIREEKKQMILLDVGINLMNLVGGIEFVGLIDCFWCFVLGMCW